MSQQKNRKMPKDNTLTYIHQFSLKTCPWQVRKLVTRMNALGDLYNGMLGEGFKRLNKLRKDPAHQQCIKEYKVLMTELKPLERKHNTLISTQQDKVSSASLKSLEKQMKPLLAHKKSLQSRFSELDKKTWIYPIRFSTVCHSDEEQFVYEASS